MSSFTSKTSVLSSSPSVANHRGSVSVLSNNNKDWDLGNDVFLCCYEKPTGETMQAGMPSVQSGLDGHLPLLRGRHHDPQGGLMLGLNQSSGCLDPGPVDFYIESDDDNVGPLFESRKRTRSNSSRHRFNEIVTELGPEEVRWFYKEDKKTWKPFVGHDSLKIELAFRKFCELNLGTAKRPGTAEVGGREDEHANGVKRAAPVPVETRTSSVHGDLESVETSVISDERDLDNIRFSVEAVCVRGGLYEVDVKERQCYPVYWNRKYKRVYETHCLTHSTVFWVNNNNSYKVPDRLYSQAPPPACTRC